LYSKIIVGKSKDKTRSPTCSGVFRYYNFICLP